ncbi:MAG TPA: DOMON-like domain-containing protein [Steroidobacteraceae bacterium]|jgi:hypothetical protein
MSPVSLLAHPSTPNEAVRSLLATALVTDRALLSIDFELAGDLSQLRLPAASPPQRAEELWKHTCFEAFVTTQGGGYIELNFSPSTQWAVYSFTGYRNGMRPVELGESPRVSVERHASALRVTTVTRLPSAVAAPRLGLSAVIEGLDGKVSYWAARHAAGKPDFHHPDTFVVTS